LAKLISAEDQKLMLTSEGRHFVAEPLTRATTSMDPTSPKSDLVLALALVLGGFAGAALVLIRAALSNTKVA
jgi:capsular polysaccharide biosynthesis protein